MKDRSSIGLTFAKKPPKYEMLISEFANMAIDVPPNDPHYKAEATFRFRADARILSFAPHMHWRGKDYRYEVIYPDGKRETLLSVPRWDFNWQNVYRFEEPIKVPKGTKLHAVAHWDNSREQPAQPGPEEVGQVRLADVGRDDGRLRRLRLGAARDGGGAGQEPARARPTSSSTAST